MSARDRHHDRSDARTRRGAILIIVMWVCFSLVSLVLVSGQSQALAYRGTANRVAAAQAREAVEGAARYAAYLAANLEEAGHLPNETEALFEAMPIGEAHAWILGRPVDETTYAEPAYGLIDESSKLNLNTATAAMLEGLPRMTPELAAAIIDWRDADDDIGDGGAESSTYLLKDPPYECKNAPFETVEELLLVEGMDETILYGEDANRNGLLDPNENDGTRSPPDDDADGVLEPGLAEYVTVYTHERNVRADGSARINVNTSMNQVAPLLTDALGQSRTAEVMQRLRGTRNYRSVLEVFVRSGMTTAEFAGIEDALTVSGDDSLEGLVNVNTAPSVVLACLPGIDEGEAAEIVSYRLTHDTTGQGIAWVADVLDQKSVLEAGPHLTSRSSQATVDAAALGRHGRGYRRTLFVMDFSGDIPVFVYRRDMEAYGWALGDLTVRGNAAWEEEGTW